MGIYNRFTFLGWLVVRRFSRKSKPLAAKSTSRTSFIVWKWHVLCKRCEQPTKLERSHICSQCGAQATALVLITPDDPDTKAMYARYTRLPTCEAEAEDYQLASRFAKAPKS